MSEVIDPEVEPQDEPTPEPEQEPVPEPDEPADPPEDALERTVRTREYEVAMEQGDGRTIDARIVPYNVPAQVADPPFFIPYMESFVPGAFDKQTRAADKVKVWLNFEHEGGLRGIVGHGVSLVDEGANFLRATFRVHDNADGDKALQMVGEGLLTGMSVEYVPLKSRKDERGVMQRLRAHLDKVSLCRFPAYQGAEIVAVRAEPIFADIDVPQADPELTERLAKLGIKPITRMEVTHTAWNNDPDRYSDEEWEAACLVDRGGDGPAKERFDLPALEPDGAINMNALEPCVSILQRGALRGLDTKLKVQAAQTLMRYYNRALLDAPAQLVGMARGKAVSPHKPLKRIVVTGGPWDGSASRYTDEQYQRATLIDRGGDGSVKERCSIPVLEPDGTLNVNALGPAAGALEGARTALAGVSQSMKEAAARKLLRYYVAAQKTPPDSLRKLAGGAAS